MPDKKQLILPVLSVLAVLAWVLFIYSPMTGEIKRLDERMKDLRMRESRRISPLDIQIKRGKVDSLNVKVGNHLAFFYPEDELLDLGRVMEKTGKEYGLVLESIVPDHNSLALFNTDEQISELPVTLLYTGKFMQLADFLDGVPDFDVPFKLNEIAIEKDDPDSAELRIEMRGVIVISTMTAEDEGQVQART